VDDGHLEDSNVAVTDSSVVLDLQQPKAWKATTKSMDRVHGGRLHPLVSQQDQLAHEIDSTPMS
jgi:hypothetical protein